MKVPRAARYLLITCADPQDGQFRAVSQACRLLTEGEGAFHIAWQGGGPLQPDPGSGLRWVAVSGHGAPGLARVGDGCGLGLRPADLHLGPGVALYLLACSQGSEAILQEWTTGTGATAYGCAGETESALSALFLLALLEHGPESAGSWFCRWREANDRLRPHFPEMRQLYEINNRGFAATLSAIAAVVDLGDFGDILSVARRYGPMLDRLG